MEGLEVYFKQLEEYLTDPLLVENTQYFVSGDMNTELMKANFMSQNLKNLLSCSEMISKTPKAITRLDHNGHGSCFVKLRKKNAIVSSTVSD